MDFYTKSLHKQMNQFTIEECEEMVEFANGWKAAARGKSRGYIYNLRIGEYALKSPRTAWRVTAWLDGYDAYCARAGRKTA